MIFKILCYMQYLKTKKKKEKKKDQWRYLQQ